MRARGAEAPLEVVVEEAGCRFAVDVTAPLGVGFYPDLRRGRDAVAARAADRRVLNLFSYTGAFSIRAAHAGAREVVSVDSVAKVHARARRNAELSGLAAGRIEEVTMDATKALERFASLGRKFDIVVCDPPTFSHAQGSGTPFSVTRGPRRPGGRVRGRARARRSARLLHQLQQAGPGRRRAGPGRRRRRGRAGRCWCWNG